MALTSQQNFGAAPDQDVRKPLPVFVVAVNDQRHIWICCDIAQPFEFTRRSSFGLFVDRRKKFFAVKGEANRNDQRLTERVDRGKVRDAGGAYEP